MRLVHALIVMKALRFDVPLPWTSFSLYDWYDNLGANNYIEMEDGNSFCCQQNTEIYWKVGSSTAEPAVDGIMALTFVAGLIHEARHLQVGQHPCQRRWDDRVDDLGSNGAQTRFYEFLAQHTDPSVIPVEYRPYLLHRACEFRGILFCFEPAGTCVS